jgi:hypothetical protein
MSDLCLSQSKPMVLESVKTRRWTWLDACREEGKAQPQIQIKRMRGQLPSAATVVGMEAFERTETTHIRE